MRRRCSRLSSRDWFRIPTTRGRNPVTMNRGSKSIRASRATKPARSSVQRRSPSTFSAYVPAHPPAHRRRTVTPKYPIRERRHWTIHSPRKVPVMPRSSDNAAVTGRAQRGLESTRSGTYRVIENELRRASSGKTRSSSRAIKKGAPVAEARRGVRADEECSTREISPAC